MTTTVEDRWAGRAGARDDAGMSEPLGPPAGATVDALLEARQRQATAAVDQLRLVTHWVDLHTPVTPDASVTEKLGREGRLALAGPGAALASEFAVAELAPALQLTERATRAYAGEALELRDRLPRLWSRVMVLEVDADRARAIARRTMFLPAEAALWLDEQITSVAHRVSVRRVLAAVDAALMRYDTDAASALARTAADHRSVEVRDHVDGTSTVTAVTSTVDAAAFDQALNLVAAALANLGDDDGWDVRRARAVGWLADPRAALDLVATPEAADPGAADPEPAGDLAPQGHRDGRGRFAFRSRSGIEPVIHLHLHTDALTSRQGAARVQVRGSSHPVPLAAVERWLAELAPGARITATPVVDLADDIAVDAYEHPRRLRAQVEERDLTCLFPWCGHQGWFDLDHIEPYATTGTGARGGPPPGQTSTSNTGRLCRLHHRVKTHGSWAYQRVGPAAVRWCSPVGQRYHVDRLGTVRLT